MGILLNQQQLSDMFGEKKKFRCRYDVKFLKMTRWHHNNKPNMKKAVHKVIYGYGRSQSDKQNENHHSSHVYISEQSNELGV